MARLIKRRDLICFVLVFAALLFFLPRNKSLKDDYYVTQQGKFRLFARILSNDLPPLHGPEQTYLNTKLILETEFLPADFRRLWILNRIVNKTVERKLIQLLQSNSEAFEIIELPRSKNPKTIKTSALNVNKARNFAVQTGFKMGADWVFVFDGNAYVTQESLDTFSTFARKPSSSFLYFIPMVRLQYKIDISMNRTFEDLFEFVSGQQECQIAVHRTFEEHRRKLRYFRYHRGFLFNERMLYSDSSKLKLLQDGMKLPKGSVHCLKDYSKGWDGKKSTSWEEESDFMEKCGYVIRLLYHPEASSPFNQSPFIHTRGKDRHEGVVNFEKTVKKYMGAGLT